MDLLESCRNRGSGGSPVVVGTVEASLLILVVGPVLAEKVGIPGLVGLILGGMIVGPFVLGWEEQGGLISALGAIGILYLSNTTAAAVRY